VAYLLFNQKNKERSYYLLAGLFPTVIDAYINLRIVPPSSGYLIYPLQATKLIPYKDYFLPVTPLSYFFAHLTAGGNYGLRNMVLASLWIVPFFGMTCYGLARTFVNRFNALMLCFLMESFICSMRLEQLGGWNMEMFMLMTVGVGFLTKSILHCNDQAFLFNSRITKYKIYGIFAGLFFALSVIEKQTCGLVLIIFSFFTLLWIIFLNKKAVRKNAIKLILNVCIGFFPPMLLIGIFLYQHNALNQFIASMLSGGGKNPNFLKFPNQVYTAITYNLSASTLIAISVIAILILNFSILEKINNFLIEKKISNEVSNYLVLLSGSFSLWRFSGFYISSQQTSFVLQDLLICLFPFIISSLIPNIHRALKTFLFGFVMLFLPFVYIYPSRRIPGGIFYLGTQNNYLIDFAIISLILTSIMLWKKPTPGVQPTWYKKLFNLPNLSYEKFRTIIFLTNFYSIGTLAHLFSSGGYIFFFCYMTSVLVYFCLVVNVFQNMKINFIFKNVPTLIIVLTITSQMTHSFVSPYTWFNWNEPNIFSKHFASSLPGLHGIQLSKADNSFYSRISSDSKKAILTENIARQKATVFAYPTIPMAAVVTGLKIDSSTMCTLWIWFDSCTNSQLVKDLNNFKRSSPNVVIWEPIPPDIISANEAAFVHQKSAIRLWEEFRNKQVARSNWKLIDTFTSPYSNNWTVFVYSVHNPK